MEQGYRHEGNRAVDTKVTGLWAKRERGYGHQGNRVGLWVPEQQSLGLNIKKTTRRP